MYAITGTHSLYLHKGALLSVPDLAGLQVACREGSLWLTQDRDPRDIVLAAGERFDGTEHRRAVIYALEAACLTLRPVRGAVPQPSRARRWANWLAPAPA
jgi:hypothetical protein